MVIRSQPNLRKVVDNKEDSPSISIGGSFVDLIKSLKYLGAQLDNSLDWNHHDKASCYWHYEIRKEIRTE